MQHYSIELTGTFPRSEALVAATRDFDRKRITASRLVQIRHAQQDEVLSLQKKLGITPLSDGMLNWQDIFRPFAEICSGIQPVTLTRFADTNTFFRQPKITGAVRYAGKHVSEYFLGMHKKGEWKATLPSPFFFARVADDRHYSSVRKLAFSFADSLAHLIIHLKKAGYSSFQLYDPYLGYLGATPGELRLVTDTTNHLIEATHAALGYYVAFTCSKTVAATLLKLPLDAVGVDFFNTDMHALPSFKGKLALIAGCLDSRTSLVEDAKTLAKFLRDVNTTLAPREVRATSTVDLQFVPVKIAEQKLLHLRRAIQSLTS